jgi:hypothetical protein
LFELFIFLTNLLQLSLERNITTKQLMLQILMAHYHLRRDSGKEFSDLIIR